ncbi:MAG: hypothetical protein ACRCZ6_17660 [Kluyvera sp.]|uniref:hypothetical protein n=1 Tax=Kluyvera sp. TaxID=1538228 RepID=UPI003F2D8E10
MSQNALNQPLTSQSLGANGGNQQAMVTGAQVMQFLGTSVEQGGSNGIMAQDVLQLMQQQSTAIVDDITRQMAPVVQLIAPRETQVASALSTVCEQYQPQIAQQQSARAGQSACTALGNLLKQLPASQTPEGRPLIRQLQQGRLPDGETAKHQLGQLLEQVQGKDDSGRLSQLLKQLAKNMPDSRELVQKALVNEEHRHKDDEPIAAKDKASLTELTRTQGDQPTADGVSYPIGQRQGRQQEGSSQQNTSAEEGDEIEVSAVGGTRRVGQQATATATDTVDDVALSAQASQTAAVALRMAAPVVQTDVSAAQAERAVQHIMHNNQASLSGLTQVPLDGLLLQAATLGLKTFSNTADAVSKSIKINSDAQARLSDKKIADYQDQLAKAREQEHKSKKAKFWSAIFSPITKLLNVIFKPIVDLLKKIPGVEQAFNWIKKNISEIALPLAIISSLVCPMSLPMTLGLLAVTSAAAGFSIANKILGDKAPQWLKITDQVGDMLAGMTVMFSAMSMLGSLSKVGQMAGKLFNFLGNKTETLKHLGEGLQAFTSLGDGVSQYVIGKQMAGLQKELGYIEATLGLDEMQAGWLQSAQTNAVSNLENILSRAATVSESASRAISESGSLRARLSNAIV